jgi:hypothetical protein
MLEEMFGVRVHAAELHALKGLMARTYRATYRSLLKAILAGNLLHVDETEVKLQTGKGYVWVFTNLEEVVYLYRPTREGDFLKDLLRDFKGVLVSDFYAAYDSLACPQQKCLIHLMRDMNQELLNNPYDEDVRAVSFLRFLLSRERNIDAISQGRHRRRRLPTVEMYPTGRLRPDLPPPMNEPGRPRTYVGD